VLGGLKHPAYGRFISRIRKSAPETDNPQTSLDSKTPSAFFSY